MSGYINLGGQTFWTGSGNPTPTMSGLLPTNINTSGVLFHHIGSGDVFSGPIDFTDWGVTGGAPTLSGVIPTPPSWICGSIGAPAVILCSKCKKPVSYSTDVISVAGASGFYERWCWECAGYDYGARDFSAHREHWIRESVPLDYHTPAQIMADWLEENGKDAAAAYMRSTLTSGG